MSQQDDFRIGISVDISELVSGLDQAASTTESTASEMQSALERSGDGMRTAADTIEKESSRATDSIEKIHGGVNDLAKTLTSLGSAGGILGALGLGGLGTAMDKVIQESISLGESIRNTSALLGSTYSTARGFSEGLSALGVSSGAVSMALRRLETDAAAGGKRLNEIGLSARNTNGTFKDAITIFEQVVTQLQNIADPGERSAAAMAMFGRAGTQLLGVLDQIPSTLNSAIDAQERNTEANAAAVSQAEELQRTLTELKSAWDDAVIAVGPAVVSMLSYITGAFQTLVANVRNAIQELQAFAHFDFSAIGQAEGLTGPGGLVDRLKQRYENAPDLSQEATDALMHPKGGIMAGDPSQAAQEGSSYGASFSAGALAALKQHNTDFRNATAEGWAKMGQEGATVPQMPMDVHFDKDANKKAKGGGGGGKGRDTTMRDIGMDDQLKKLDEAWGKASETEKTLMTEMTQDAGSKFQQMAQQASQDFQQMQSAHENFAQALRNHDQAAAKQFGTDWQIAFQKFQQDSKKAEEQFKKDQDEVQKEAKKVAQSIGQEFSNAFTGLVNGTTTISQVFTNLLEKMLGELIQYAVEMAIYWAMMGGQMKDSTTSAFGGILGALVNYITQSLALHAGGAAAKKTIDLGLITSDAGVGAAGAAASQASVPYVGPVLAVSAATAMESFIMAFASAAQGYDIPAGVSPLTQLHPREMVLPSDLAEGVRGMVRGGGGGAANGRMGGNGGGGSTYETHIHAIDAQSFEQRLSRSDRHIANLVASKIRDGQYQVGY